MTTLITIKDTLLNIAGAAAGERLRFAPRGISASTMSTNYVDVPSDTSTGAFTAQLQPGQAMVSIGHRTSIPFTVPSTPKTSGDGSYTLWELIQANVQIPAATPAQVIQQAVASQVGSAVTDQVSEAIEEADLGQVPLRTLYRPMTDIISSSVLTTDQYLFAAPSDYTNLWGTRWDSANYNTQGQNLIPVTAGTPASGCINDSSGRYTTSGSSKIPFGSVIDIEFIFTGDKLDIMMQTFGYFDSQVYIEDEGRMKKAKPLPLAGNYSGYSYRSLRFAEIATRRIRVVMPAVYFVQIMHERSAILAPSPDRPLIVTTGDSYFESCGAYNSGSARSFVTYGMIDALIEATGFAVARCAQGGTGYFNDGTGAAGSLTAVASNTAHTSPFGSAPRVAYYGKFLGSVAKPVAVLVNGTCNDGGLSGDGTNASQAGMQTRVTALLNAIAARDPKVGIVAIGPEPINDSYGSGAHATNRLGIQAAIAAHAQGIGFADANNPTTPWWTGTGYEKSVSTSQQAQMVGADQIHPNWFGHKYYGSRIAAAIGDFRVPKDRAERAA
ncbi:hypothetical protein GCM10027169_13300 [Gordonia jinhuaensis]|uniref:Uncharacterized protein n=1 Tax=Gordonia jinhuaensis TaxID=1517702 RepID=A0A916SY53_9ACTN|nr:SGNH/GDSL hydrolase family protein [Gordonia jinhuaensis]GGB22689.1 hypothetical protein GCM10011489_08640 [Gordonia jinhuaensis]